MRVGFSVMAHINRADAAMDLSERLGFCDIAWDGPRSNWGEVANGDRAWLLHDPSTDWHVVLQDDAQPIDGFTEHAAAALAACRPQMVSFYTGTGRPAQIAVGHAIKKADMVGAAWLEHPRLLWGVAVAMPTRWVPRFHRWGLDRPGGLYDKRLSEFTRSQGVPVRYTLPSLVDHADGPTLLDHPYGAPTVRRKAWRLGVPKSWDTRTVVIA